MNDARGGREAGAAIAAASLVSAGVYLGPGTGPGAGLLGAGVLAVGALLVIPSVVQAGSRRRWTRAILQLADRGLRARAPEELGAILAESHALTSAGRAVLVVPGQGGDVVAISSDAVLTVETGGEIEVGFSRLLAAGVPTPRGDEALEPLMAALDVAVAVPLVHRDLLIGVVGFTEPELLQRSDYLESVGVIATVCLANTFLDREARSRSRLRELFDLAGEMQRSLAPPAGDVDIDLGGPVLRSVRIAGVTSPMSECGGDVLAWRQSGGGELALLIGDAAGHGAAPALVAALVKGAFDALVARAGAQLDPGAILGELDRQVAAAGRGAYQMTALVAAVSGVGAIRIAGAGTFRPLVVGARGVRPIEIGGDPLGSGAGPWRPIRVDVDAGDKLIAYTDGLVEAGAPVVAPLGERRLRAAVAGAARLSPGELCAALLAEVDRFLGGQEPADDITAVVVEVAG